MNKIFKVIYDRSLGRQVVVSELAKSHGKAKTAVGAVLVAAAVLGGAGMASADTESRLIALESGQTQIRQEITTMQGKIGTLDPTVLDAKLDMSKFDEQVTKQGEVDAGQNGKIDANAAGIQANTAALGEKVNTADFEAYKTGQVAEDEAQNKLIAGKLDKTAFDAQVQSQGDVDKAQNEKIAANEKAIGDNKAAVDTSIAGLTAKDTELSGKIDVNTAGIAANKTEIGNMKTVFDQLNTAEVAEQLKALDSYDDRLSNLQTMSGNYAGITRDGTRDEDGKIVSDAVTKIEGKTTITDQGVLTAEKLFDKSTPSGADSYYLEDGKSVGENLGILDSAIDDNAFAIDMLKKNKASQDDMLQAQQDIKTEAATRFDKDKELGLAIVEEKTARETADNALQGSIEKEVGDRTAADAALEKKIVSSGADFTAFSEKQKGIDARQDAQISGLRTSIERTGALTGALAGLHPAIYDPMAPTQVMGSVATYKGEFGYALGVAHYLNENFMLNGGIAYDGHDEFMGNVGFTVKMGQGGSNVPSRYQAGPISSIYVLQQENEEMRERLAALEARLAELDNQ